MLRSAADDQVPYPFIDARDASTRELVSVVLEHPSGTAPACDAIADLVDTGRLSPAQLRGSAAALPEGVTASDARRIEAAVELSRRLACAPRPPIIRRPNDVAAIAMRELGDLAQERLLVVVCDAASRSIADVLVASGAVDHCPVPVRDVITSVLVHGGRAFALAHNHPSGDPTPSDEDRDATRIIADAARVLGLRFLGHIVVAGDKWCEVTSRVRRTPG